MSEQENIKYDRIEKAIEYIKSNFKQQPTLNQIAEQVHLSPFHFQRLFSEWAGTTPKKFLQYISIEHAKKILTSKQATLFDAAQQTGLSGTSRLHDLFVKIEGMTPAEYKNGGRNLAINFSFAMSHFGNVMVAATQKGVCYIAFEANEEEALNNLKKKFPNATFQKKLDPLQQNALALFQNDWSNMSQLKLHVKGTDFQIKVWESLLKIPQGNLATYGNIADQIGNSKASRAVGTAIGSNPIAFLIPCHRVIQSSGNIGGYMWGNTRKTAIIGWEQAKTNTEI